MSDKPTVSVVMATYNHAAYVGAAIRSVLEQTFQDFELIISDDGSKDTTREVVAGFTDRRIAFFPNTENRGACVVTNELIGRARGKYVAVINSDDFWEPDKLATQVAFMDSHPEYGALFGQARFIDPEGKDISGESIHYSEIFTRTNRSQAQWLRYFFEHGNCLCHPTILIRRECYDAAGVLDNRLRQIPDLDLWVRLAKQYRFFVTDKILINFRVVPGSASDPSRPNEVRRLNETFFIAQGFFDGITADTLTEGFGDLMRTGTVATPHHLDIEKALLFFADIEHVGHLYRIVGLEKLHTLLQSPAHRDILQRDYAIDDRYFQALMAQSDAFLPLPVEHRVNVEVPPDPNLFLRSLPGAMVLDELKHRLLARIGLTLSAKTN